jgi:hypothetical protein
MLYGCDSSHIFYRNEADIMGKESSDLACNFGAIQEGEREQHKALANYLVFEGFKEKQALADGYAFRFDESDYSKVTQYVANERLCCPFLTFEIRVEAQRGSIWLRLRGEEEVKTFLDTAFSTGEFTATGKGQLTSKDFLEEGIHA